jgi:site-specific DNA-methyltransferase (cytosine-N4-specific)
MTPDLGTAQVIRADARSLPLADNSVDLVVTSPPYFALRSYQDGGETYAGQIGSEPTPAEFVDALLEVTRECVRVLKPSGSMWVNLGDTYRDRGLLGIPWRYALGCIGVGEFPCDLARELVWDVFSGVLSAAEAQEAIDSWDTGLGLKMRAEVIWAKTDGLPGVGSDRVRRTHEQWFHFASADQTYSDLDAIRSPYEGEPQRRFSPRIKDRVDEGRPVGEWSPVWAEQISGENQLGKVPGSVWGAATSKFVVPEHIAVPHFAAFPTYFPRRIITGWCPEGGTVLDPFGGTGTTALVAKALGRHGISVDMSADYCRLAEWRTNDRNQLAKVLGIEKVAPMDNAQLDLFGGVA